MTAKQRNLLFVGIEFDLFESLAASRPFREFHCDYISTGSHATELIELLPYEGVVIAHPLPDIATPRLIEALRRSGSSCRTAAVILLAAEGTRSEAESLVGAGANRVLASQESAAELRNTLERLLQVAPRVRARVISRLTVPGSLGTNRIMCQTVNLSASGMLVRTEQRCEPGAVLDFELMLPGDRAPVRGKARVVRRAMPQRERVTGLALQFDQLPMEDSKRLQDHLSALMN